MAKHEIWSKNKDGSMSLILSDETPEPIIEIKAEHTDLSNLISLLKKKGVI